MMTNVKDYRSLLREIQNSTTTVYSTLPSEEPRFLIDINSRTINVPSEFGFLAIENDHNSQKVYFEIDRFFDGIDLAEHTCIIQFINIEKTKTSSNERPKPNVGKCPNKCLNVPAINVPPASEPKKEEGYFVVTEMDVESIEGKIIFEWKVENKATSLAGDIFFSVRFYSIDDSGGFVYNFNTLPAHSLILDTLDVINGNSSIDSSEIEVLLTKFKDFKNEIDAKVDVAQGSENSGKFLAINELGNVDVVALPDISSSKEIYVGSGDMPDGYTLQIDPNGEADDMVDDYLAKGNEIEYTPIGNYNPATKKYVDDSVSELDSSKVDVAQGEENYGKILAINESGDVEVISAPASTDVTYDESKKRLVFSSKTRLPGNVNVDPTLSVSGDVADAKVVGDALNTVNKTIEEVKTKTPTKLSELENDLFYKKRILCKSLSINDFEYDQDEHCYYTEIEYIPWLKNANDLGYELSGNIYGEYLTIQESPDNTCIYDQTDYGIAFENEYACFYNNIDYDDNGEPFQCGTLYIQLYIDSDDFTFNLYRKDEKLVPIEYCDTTEIEDAIWELVDEVSIL